MLKLFSSVLDQATVKYIRKEAAEWKEPVFLIGVFWSTLMAVEIDFLSWAAVLQTLTAVFELPTMNRSSNVRWMAMYAVVYIASFGGQRYSFHASHTALIILINHSVTR